MWFKTKDEGVGTFFYGNSFCKIQSGWTSPGGPLDASKRGTLSQYLAPRMLVKTRYQNIFFFSFISLQFINNTSFTLVFLYKRLQKEKESLEVIARKRKGMQMDYVDGFNKKSYKGR